MVMIKNFMMLLSLSLVFYSCTKPCDDTNCFNNGVCVDGDCLCPDGFYGVNCELEIEDNNVEIESSIGCNSDVINYNGYTYELVEVNGKCWFAENLLTTQFNNGDPLSEETNIFNWTSNNDNLNYIETWPYTEIQGHNGLLYSGNVIMDERNICPSGWHVSTDLDWLEIEELIGVSENEINIYGYNRGAGKRGILCSNDFYGTDSLGLNIKSTGFIGDCAVSEFYEGDALVSVYWTSTTWQGDNYLIDRDFTNIFANTIGRIRSHKSYGKSVRCVKD